MGGDAHFESMAAGPYMLVVSSTPSPRIGTVDLSVAVQALDLGGDTHVRILAAPVGRSDGHRDYEAVREADSPNRYHASVGFPTAGSWSVAIRVSGPAGTREAHLDVEVSHTVMGATPAELTEFSLPAIALLAVMLIGRLRRTPEHDREQGPPPEPCERAGVCRR